MLIILAGCDSLPLFGPSGEPDRPFPPVSYVALQNRDPAEILWIAHRGFRSLPENTIPAILASFDQGADAVEVDVRITRDGVPILMHDATVDRTTNGTGRVHDLLATDVARMDACERASKGALQCPVPTLRDALSVSRSLGPLVLDIGHMSYAGVQAVLRDLKETGTRPLAVVISSSAERLRWVKQSDRGIALGLVAWDASAPASVWQAGAFLGLLPGRLSDESLLYAYQAEGVPFVAHTVTTADQYLEWHSRGVRWFVSDIPRPSPSP
jgi:glycerophosphoryl diester phosphodiesterase